MLESQLKEVKVDINVSFVVAIDIASSVKGKVNLLLKPTASWDQDTWLCYPRNLGCTTDTCV